MKRCFSLLLLVITLVCIFLLTSCSEKIGKGYIYTVDNGEVTVRQYLGFQKSVTIPEEIDGYPVRYVGPLAFQNKWVISVTVPEGVLEIQARAFENCPKLKSVDMPDSLVLIGSGAFENCMALESIEIPKNVQAIDMHAFYRCTALTEIDLPDSVEHVGSWAFDGCTSLERVSFGNGILSIGTDIFDGCGKIKFNVWENGVYIENGDNPYFALYGLENYEVDNFEFHPNTKIICGRALQTCKFISSITIPEGIVSIGNYAFSNCEELESISLPSSLKYISDITPFSDNYSVVSSLKEINVPAESQYFKTVDGVLFSKDGKRLIKYPALLEKSEYSVPDGVESIDSGAFQSARELKNVSLPNSLRELSSFAFAYCSSLESIDLGSGIKAISEGAFYYCTSLKAIDIPDNVERLEGAFTGCTNLTSVVIGKGVIYIETPAFTDCEKLESVDFEDPIGWYVAFPYYGSEDVDVSDPAKNVELLLRDYSNGWWHKRQK